MSEEACRLDIWLWRARFFKTRSLAARFIEGGRMRLTRREGEIRVGKAAQTVKPGDNLVFAMSGRLFAVRIAALGDRRGPASEARALYETVGENAALQENWPSPDLQQR
jgi:ribosome-associated heat shock protein Hsp15